MANLHISMPSNLYETLCFIPLPPSHSHKPSRKGDKLPLASNLQLQIINPKSYIINSSLYLHPHPLAVRSEFGGIHALDGGDAVAEIAFV
jgi:hypothetical protein